MHFFATGVLFIGRTKDNGNVLIFTDTLHKPLLPPVFFFGCSRGNSRAGEAEDK